MGIIKKLMGKFTGTNNPANNCLQHTISVFNVITNNFSPDTLRRLEYYMEPSDKQMYDTQIFKEYQSLTANDWYELGVVLFNGSYNMSRKAVIDLWNSVRGAFEDQAKSVLERNPDNWYFKGMTFDNLETIDHFLTCEVSFLDGSSIKIPFLGHYESNYGPSYYCLNIAEEKGSREASLKLSEMIDRLYWHNSMKYQNYRAVKAEAQKHRDKYESI